MRVRAHRICGLWTGIVISETHQCGNQQTVISMFGQCSACVSECVATVHTCVVKVVAVYRESNHVFFRPSIDVCLFYMGVRA